MLLAEDLLLLLTDDTTGRKRQSGYLDYALAGAVLIDLMLAGRVRLTEKGETAARPNRVVVESTDPTDDALLDERLAKLAPKSGMRPQRAIEILRKGLQKSLYARLCEAGVVRHEPGLLGTSRYPAVDTAHETALRQNLFEVLGRGGEPDDRLASLIGLLSALDLAHKVVAEDVSTVDKRAIKKRAKLLREQNWAAQAAYKAIQAVQAATVAAASGGA